MEATWQRMKSATPFQQEHCLPPGFVPTWHGQRQNSHACQRQLVDERKALLAFKCDCKGAPNRLPTRSKGKPVKICQDYQSDAPQPGVVLDCLCVLICDANARHIWHWKARRGACFPRCELQQLLQQDLKSSQPKSGPRWIKKAYYYIILHYGMVYSMSHYHATFFDILCMSLSYCVIVEVCYHSSSCGSPILLHHTSNPALHELQNAAWQQSCCMVV